MKKKSKRQLEKQLELRWQYNCKVKDNFRCAICGSKDVKLNCHHIISRHLKLTRWDFQNSILVCPRHHLFDKKISFHGGSLGAIEWLRVNRPEQYSYLIKMIKGGTYKPNQPIWNKVTKTITLLQHRTTNRIRNSNFLLNSKSVSDLFSYRRSFSNFSPGYGWSLSWL